MLAAKLILLRVYCQENYYSECLNGYYWLVMAFRERLKTIRAATNSVNTPTIQVYESQKTICKLGNINEGLTKTICRLGNLNWALTKIIKGTHNCFCIVLAGFIGARKKHQ